MLSQFLDERPIVIDLFAGSCNLLYHLSKGLNAAYSYAIERDQIITKFTKHNLKAIGYNCELINGDYTDIKNYAVELASTDLPIVFILSPPWGNGFTHEKGLDLL